jgi:hypothetical protein
MRKVFARRLRRACMPGIYIMFNLPSQIERIKLVAYRLQSDNTGSSGLFACCVAPMNHAVNKIY